VAPGGKGAFAVVDVDTLWRPHNGAGDSHWCGRGCKIYTQLDGEWKLIAHTGLLSYPPRASRDARPLPLPDPPLQDDRFQLRPWTQQVGGRIAAIRFLIPGGQVHEQVSLARIPQQVPDEM
jgi:hypothetical protein